MLGFRISGVSMGASRNVSSVFLLPWDDGDVRESLSLKQQAP